MLTDPRYSAPCALGDILVKRRNFASRREFAEYINQRVVEAGVFADADEHGMWEWLSLLYFDAVCPISPDGQREPGVDGRHLLEDPDARRRHRHLLRGPYMSYRRYNGGPNGELDLLLSYALPVHGIAATHLGERLRLMASPGALIAASRLYVHPISGKPKRGYSDEEIGLRAYCRFLNNLPDCFDLSNLSADTIIALLPASFSVWLNDTENLKGSSPTLFKRLKEVSELRDDRSVARRLDDLLAEIGTRKMTERQVAVRSNMFRTAVLGAYESKCAISGMGLRSADGMDTGFRFEVEAAHIVPVSRGGKDLVRNGLALCRMIHWAFDNGMLWINREYRINLSKDADKDSRNDWLGQFRGRKLRMPVHESQHPDREALRWHARNASRVT
ncbi:MAG: HNH endonuclease [Gammaproteobacteria bacterium]|nr:HNH endonuclease [Gammaproteobacteria bacterium]